MDMGDEEPVGRIHGLSVDFPSSDDEAFHPAVLRFMMLPQVIFGCCVCLRKRFCIINSFRLVLRICQGPGDYYVQPLWQRPPEGLECLSSHYHGISRSIPFEKLQVFAQMRMALPFPIAMLSATAAMIILSMRF